MFGTLIGALKSIAMFWQAAIFLGLDLWIACPMAWTWCDVSKLNADQSKSRAISEDQSVQISKFIVLAADVAQLAAVGLVPVKDGNAIGATKR